MPAVVVTFEHLPLGQLACYGNTWIRTPHFDRLAAEGTVFDGCFAEDLSHQFASAATPRPSAGARHMAEFVAGALELGVDATVVEEDADLPFDDAIVRLFETAARVVGKAERGSSRSLIWVRSQGVRSPWHTSNRAAETYWRALFPSKSLQEVLADFSAGTRMDASRAAPGGALASLLPELAAAGLLTRGSIPEDSRHAALSRAVYGACVSTLDAAFGELLDAFGAGLSGDGLLVVASFAGELLTAHPLIAKGCPPLVDALAHVPLLVRAGEDPRAGSRRGELVSTSDLATTVADWLGIPIGDERARSWLPVLRGDAATARDEVFFGAGGVGGGVRTREFACLCPAESLVPRGDVDDAADAGPEPRPWLFVKPDDAWDMLDVASQYPEQTAELAARVAAAATRGTISRR